MSLSYTSMPVGSTFNESTFVMLPNFIHVGIFSIIVSKLSSSTYSLVKITMQHGSTVQLAGLKLNNGKTIWAKINLVSTTLIKPNTALQMVHRISIRLVYKTCHECNTKCHMIFFQLSPSTCKIIIVEGSIIDHLRDYAPTLGSIRRCKF